MRTTVLKFGETSSAVKRVVNTKALPFVQEPTCLAILYTECYSYIHGVTYGLPLSFLSFSVTICESVFETFGSVHVLLSVEKELMVVVVCPLIPLLLMLLVVVDGGGDGDGDGDGGGGGGGGAVAAADADGRTTRKKANKGPAPA
ncbi:hypothetical protein V1477_014558 [Vespula maculifrons]|uniref:Uncharacterized protein n=1 Tax=Vespula maculifrons TaxID=7453 RepID=A0ABD2BHT2_VESMC